MCGNYSREETIQGQTLFAEIQYVQYTLPRFIKVYWKDFSNYRALSFFFKIVRSIQMYRLQICQWQSLTVKLSFSIGAMGISSFGYCDGVLRERTWTKCWLCTRFTTILKAAVFLRQCLLNFLLKLYFISSIYKYVCTSP